MPKQLDAGPFEAKVGGPGDPARGDLNLVGREIRVRGKGGRERIVTISYQAGRSVDRYLRTRARCDYAFRSP